MSSFKIRVLPTLITLSCFLMTGIASAETVKRTDRRMEVNDRPISTSSSRGSSSVNRTVSKPQTSTIRKGSSSNYRPPTTSYKPAQSTYQKPQRTYKPVTTTKPAATINKYRAPVTQYRPPVNNYRPPINAYKPPTSASRPSRQSAFKPVFPKPSVSTGLRRTEERNERHDDSANQNQRHNRPYSQWNAIFNNRYHPNRYNNWYQNAGHRFPIEQSYNVWSNSYNQNYRAGYSTSYLPSYYDRFSWNNTAYYSYGGLYFSGSRGSSHFSLVSAPIGYRMNSLPQHSVGFYIGNDLFFNAHNNYYRWLPTSSQYIVIDRPVYDEELVEYVDEGYPEPEDSYHVSYNDGSPIYYPAAGQSEVQMSLDLDECHIWSAKETNFDPAIPYPTYDEYKAEGFKLALEACMSSRTYTVL